MEGYGVMEKVYKHIIESINNGKIDKETAIEAIKLLKKEENKKRNKDIAVVGISCRLPSANNIDEFWRNIINRIDCISRIPKTREEDVKSYLLHTGIPEEEIKYFENAYLSDIDKFDYNFFKLSPSEARLMDPCQRIFLEEAWSAIEDAGYGGKKLYGSKTGVYVGYSSNLRDMYVRMVSEVEPSSLPAAVIPNLTALIPSRIAYLLNLKGPSLVVDTACSSALVSVYLACNAIREGTCDMAVAGGININTVPFDNKDLRMGIESSDSRSRAFDDNSDGSGIGEGVAAILLKPMDEAIKDKDNIYAVIKGCAINQDGASIGITAPNPASQTEVILSAWKDANINPETIGYIETHGTGTNLGDPIEIKGINNAFSKYTNKKQFCAVSSVKTNIGHLCEAAGIVSFIKAVLALKNKKIPPTNYFNTPNRNIKFEKLPVYVNTKLRDWQSDENPRRCGVSSFGISGTNCHIVIEETPKTTYEEEANDRYRILTLSAKTEQSLLRLVEKYNDFLNGNEEAKLSNICYTANTGRQHHNYRIALIIDSKQGLKNRLKSLKLNSDKEDNIFYGHFKIITDQRKRIEEGISEYELEGLTEEAKKKVERLRKSKNHEIDSLRELCMLYIQGAEINWEDLYKENEYIKESLPTYPFELSRCWLKTPEYCKQKESEELDKFYTCLWKEDDTENPEPNLESKKVLVFVNKEVGELESRIIDNLREISDDMFIAKVGDCFDIKQCTNEYEIRNIEEDYTNLIAEIKNKNISNIVHLTTLANKEAEEIKDVEKSVKRGIYSLLYLTKAIVRNGLDSDIKLSLISKYVYEVLKQEQLIPENASYFGLSKTIVQEYPGIKCRCTDIDDMTSVDSIIHEIFTNNKYLITAYRDGKRYIEVFSEIDIEAYEDEKVKIKENGVYLITGGTGGIGLEMAKHFAMQNNNITLILINRSEIPNRDKWNEILKEDNNKLISKIKVIREIEDLGARVELYSADVSNMVQMQIVYESIKEKHSEINGILHCAGVPGDGFLIRKEEHVFNNVINPKVYGTWVLDHLTKEDQLDFFVMFSSGLAILSEPGHGDYTAANSYLDAYAYYRNKMNKKTLTINWTSWKEAGMSVEYGVNYDSIFKTIPTVEAIDGFDRAINKAVSRVLIGEMTYNLNFLHLIDNLPFEISKKMSDTVKRIKKEAGIQKKEKKNKSQLNQSGEIEIKGKKSGHLTDIEKKIAQFYSEVLGYDEINIFDSFFELGGDSVMLNRLHAMIEKQYPGKVKLINLFTYTSIADLASFISEQVGHKDEKKIVEENESNEIKKYEDMLDALKQGSISIEEAIEDII